MKTWRAWGYDFNNDVELKPLFINAEDADDAFTKAREVDPWYSTVQLQDIKIDGNT